MIDRCNKLVVSRTEWEIPLPSSLEIVVRSWSQINARERVSQSLLSGMFSVEARWRCSPEWSSVTVLTERYASKAWSVHAGRQVTPPVPATKGR